MESFRRTEKLNNDISIVFFYLCSNRSAELTGLLLHILRNIFRRDLFLSFVLSNHIFLIFLPHQLFIMKILRAFLYFIGTVIAIGFFLPGTVHVVRSTEINAPAASIFNEVNELKNWNDWSPWAKLDPNTTWDFSLPSAGLGAYYNWKSEKRNVGNGKLTITDVKPYESIRCKMDLEGMGTSNSGFKFTAKDSTHTQVDWSFDTDFGMNPLMRWMGFAMMNKAIGEDYELGLVNLKAVVEKK